MFARYGLRIALATLLGLAISTSGFGQCNPTTLQCNQVSSTGPFIWLVATLAVGATVLILLHKRGKSQPAQKGPSYVGCTQLTDHGTVLTDEKSNEAYVILPGQITLKTGERVEISGTTDEDDAGRIALRVNRLIKDYGACNSTPAPSSATPQ